MVMNNITLFSYFRSSTSYRVRIALHYKKIPFDYKPVHLLKDGGEQHKFDYHKLNPMEEVPTLVHGKKVIAQSFAILEYLEEVFPSSPLLPTDPFLRAKIRQFCENINSFMHPLSNLKVLQYLGNKHGYNQADKDQWVQHWMPLGFTAAESLLQEFSSQHCFGDQVTWADLFLIPQIFSAQRFHVDLSAFPKVREINDRCIVLPAFQAAHPANQPDSPKE